MKKYIKFSENFTKIDEQFIAPKKCKIGKYGTEKTTFEQDWMTNIPLYAVCVI